MTGVRMAWPLMRSEAETTSWKVGRRSVFIYRSHLKVLPGPRDTGTHAACNSTIIDQASTVKSRSAMPDLHARIRCFQCCRRRFLPISALSSAEPILRGWLLGVVDLAKLVIWQPHIAALITI